ncbi:GDSL-type esterase/lipase family protein [Glycomyces harbinensis]|uniref:GDSL-like Lipase/Acylhydrolase family protein n=1 Tax=Glycomyces harbinensis TaxID=58114 RepID=A0A1G7ACB3_9ACTN|nr:GDSL-type esterase/lipase family protein [Glycomyces harbinensis]SDE12333.1 GDSL-like Lipase/Acylhydrolase family protein [Glycomyces harbinensis]
MITASIAPLVRGVAELETTARGVRPHRLPGRARAQFPDPHLLMMERQPSGARLVMATAARALRLTAHSSRLGYRGAERPRGRVDLVVDGEPFASAELDGGDLVEVDFRTGASDFRPGPAHTVAFDGLPQGDKHLEIWLPHNEAMELIELQADEPVRPVEPGGRLWVHHGSSISQGSNAASPTRIWPAVAARAGGVELRNLGLGGNALVDPFTARAIRDAPADLISVKLGINVVNGDVMRPRSFTPAVDGFLDTIRDGHPDTPLLLVSPIFCGIHEDAPGPGAVDPGTLGTGQVAFTASGDDPSGRLTLRVIREALASLAARRKDDPNLHYLDGTRLYGEADAAERPLPDALHPDTDTHRLIGERFARYAFASDGPFAA